MQFFFINEDLFLVIFILGKRLYKIVRPTGNLIVKVTKCVCVSRILPKSQIILSTPKIHLQKPSIKTICRIKLSQNWKKNYYLINNLLDKS